MVKKIMDMDSKMKKVKTVKVHKNSLFKVDLKTK